MANSFSKWLALAGSIVLGLRPLGEDSGPLLDCS